MLHTGHPGGGSLNVLRLCSVYQLRDGADLDARYDPVGGMQTHTSLLTRELDCRSVSQLVVTSRLSGPQGLERVGACTAVRRVGLRTRWLRQLWAPAALPSVLARRGGFDLVHVHQGEDLAVLPLGVLAAWWHRAPLVVTVHCSLSRTFEPTGLRRRALRVVGGRIERWGLWRARAVIVLTAAAAGLADVPADRMHVIPSGVDLAVHGRDEPDPLPAIGHPRVVFVGRLAPQKAVATLVRAAASLRHRAAQVVLVGDGPDRRRLERMSARLGLGACVHFIGFLPRPVIPAVLRHADVLVLASRYEELGSVLLEGLASSVPIVASRVGGIPEVVHDGRTGVLVPPEDPAALAEAIDRVLGEPALARSMRSAASREAGRYAWDVLADQVLTVYRGTQFPDAR